MIKKLQFLIGIALLTPFVNMYCTTSSAASLPNYNTALPFNFPASLTGFSYVVGNGPSDVQTFEINETEEIAYAISAPAGYEVSINATSGYESAFTIPGTTFGSGPVTVYVRMHIDLSVGLYEGELTIAPAGNNGRMAAEIIALEGEVLRRTTVWDGDSWNNGAPDIDVIAHIDGNYSTSLHGDFITWELVVNNPSILSITDHQFVKIQTNVEVDGQIILDSSGALVQVDDLGIFSLNSSGSSSVNKFTSVLNHWYDYTYWSSPVNGASVNQAFSSSHPSKRFWYDAANYLDVMAETDNGNTYEPGYDDVDDDGNDWILLNGTDVLQPGVGYATTHSPTGFATGTSYQYTFEGPFNTGTITTPIAYNGDNGDNDWNFIGNPYPSAIAVDAFFTENASVVGDVIYLWSHASAPDPDNNGNEAYNFSSDDYAIINAGSGELAGGKPMIPNRYIPSGQGFFVQGLANANVTFTNSMRIADQTSNDQFFRSSDSETPNKLWMNLTSNNGIFNQLLVAYIDGATDGYDGGYYDATRNLSTETAAIIYTMIESEVGKKFAIQGKASTSLDTSEIIPVGFYSSIAEATQYSFSIGQLQGSFLESTPVILKDLLLDIEHDLTASAYTFTSEVGEDNQRFEIHFNASTLNMADVRFDNNLQIMEQNHSQIQFKMTNGMPMQSISLYDTLGRLIYEIKTNGDTKVIQVSKLNQGTYIARVTLNNGHVVTKKMMRTL